jgi:four helix bundle protein
LACKIFTDFSFELKKVTTNCIDAAHSISRNISEGDCRRSLKEYLNHLNFALGSCGEFHCCYVSFKKAGQISDEDYEQLDKRHYKVENELLKLIESLQRKQKEEVWECHDCHEGVVVPGTYKNIHGELVRIDPKNLDPNTEVMRF